MKNVTWIPFALVVAVIGVLVVTDVALGEDPPAKPHGMPSPQPKIDCPFAKGILGSWSIAQVSPRGDTTGTTTFALGVGDTVILQTYEASMGPMGSFNGHGVWKPSADGKKIDCWWFSNLQEGAEHFTGTLKDTGYEVKSPDGTRLVMEAKGAGWEFKYFTPDGAQAMTDTYTKK